MTGVTGVEIIRSKKNAAGGWLAGTRLRLRGWAVRKGGVISQRAEKRRSGYVARDQRSDGARDVPIWAQISDQNEVAGRLTEEIWTESDGRSKLEPLPDKVPCSVPLTAPQVGSSPCVYRPQQPQPIDPSTPSSPSSSPRLFLQSPIPIDTLIDIPLPVEHRARLVPEQQTRRARSPRLVITNEHQ